MPIQRSGPTPQYLNYVTEYALIPQGGPASPGLLSVVTHNFQWIDVPHYQRGISWDLTTLQELLKSQSVLLGNVILGQFPVPASRFPHLPAGVPHYAVLVDGLQRFSIGTIILNALHPLVLQASPARPGDAAHLTALSARCAPLAAIYHHNDQQLSNHPRRAVADAYKVLRKEVEDDFKHQFTAGKGLALAKDVINLFLNKQIATDLYFNFVSPLELTYTFLGINTIRVELSIVDLLRSSIVENALSSNWNSADIEDIENRFTGIFIENERPKSELLPFAGIIWENLKAPSTAGHVFPSWSGPLAQNDVDSFLEFVQKFLAVDNAFVTEIRECGAIPFAGILAFYYRRFRLTGVKPAFFTGQTNDDAELHQFLCANYRVLIDGQIGRTRSFAEQLFDGRINTLTDAANKMSQDFVSLPIASPVNVDWLKSSLRKIEKVRAKRVFSAMRLPLRNAGWGQSFVPDIFGGKANEYHIDHLIPYKTVKPNKPGSSEAETLVNFAPLPSAQNRIAKATKCSSKLQPTDVYGNYVAAPNPHPYCNWLVVNQATHHSHLDDQELLQPNSTPNLGGERIDYIASVLIDRI